MKIFIAMMYVKCALYMAMSGHPQDVAKWAVARRPRPATTCCSLCSSSALNKFFPHIYHMYVTKSTENFAKVNKSVCRQDNCIKVMVL
uniref:Secreted protein n=1 Tax=Arundo donax TaxID=35708 RepID=A0A0A9DT35_ARUDO